MLTSLVLAFWTWAWNTFINTKLHSWRNLRDSEGSVSDGGRHASINHHHQNWNSHFALGKSTLPPTIGSHSGPSPSLKCWPVPSNHRCPAYGNLSRRNKDAYQEFKDVPINRIQGREQGQGSWAQELLTHIINPSPAQQRGCPCRNGHPPSVFDKISN